MYVLFILVILIILIIISIIYLQKKGKTIEKYDNSIGITAKKNLRNEFGDSTCSILDDPNLIGDGKIMARQYIQSNRIRQYKPQDDSIPDKNKCYVNFDPNNNASDYLLAGHSCDINDPLFADSPFVKNVYVDNKPEKSNDVAYNKCVIEVDPSKVKTDTLQNFWDAVGTSECLRLNQSIVDYNKTLKDKLAYDTEIFNKNSQQYSDLLGLLKQQGDTISSLQLEIQGLMSNVQENESEYETLTQSKYFLDEKFRQTDSEYKSLIEIDSKQFKDQTVKYQNTLQQYNDLYSQNAKLVGDNNVLQEQFDTLKRNYSLVSNYVNSLTTENATLLDNYNTLLSNVVKIDQEIAICSDNRELCGILSDCLQQLNQLNQDIGNLLNLINQLNDAINASNSSRQDYENKLTDCLAALGKLSARITSQYAEIERLKSLDESDCSIQINKINELTGYRDDLTSKCQPYFDRAMTNNSLQNKLIDENKQLQQQVSACDNTNNQTQSQQSDDALSKAIRLYYSLQSNAVNGQKPSAANVYSLNQVQFVK